MDFEWAGGSVIKEIWDMSVLARSVGVKGWKFVRCYSNVSSPQIQSASK